MDELDYQNMINEYANTEPSIDELFNYFGGHCNEIAKIRIEGYFRRFPAFEQQYEFLREIIEEFDIAVESRRTELTAESLEERSVAENKWKWLEVFQNISIFSNFSAMSGLASASEISDSLKFEFLEGKIYGVRIDDAETGELTIDVFTKDSSLLGCLLVLKAGNTRFSDIFQRIDSEELGASFNFSKEQRENIEPETILEIEKIIPYDKIQRSDIDEKIYEKIIFMQQSGDSEEKYISELIFKNFQKDQ